jgi:cytochrome c biogenesis protein CcmG/thiol:disulfide interchange protein DsbE
MVIRIVLISLIVGMLPVSVNANEAFDYQLRDLDGQLHRVSDHRGKWLIINFWATWCPPCIREMPELERFFQENKATAHLWGVTFEDSDRVKIQDFVKRLGVTYPILGHGQDPLTGYGNVNVLPTTFIIDPSGLFYHRFEGPISARDIVDIIERVN